MKNAFFMVMAILGLVSALAACLGGFLGFNENQVCGLVMAAVILLSPGLVRGDFS